MSAALALLIYSKIADLGHWHRFLDFVRQSLKKWGVTRWAATLEACETEGLHVHLVLQFRQKVDKTARSFNFEGLLPNVEAGDYLGEGTNGKKQEQSVNRALGAQGDGHAQSRRIRVPTDR